MKTGPFCFQCNAAHAHEVPARFDPPVAAGLRRDYLRNETRRQFFGRLSRGVGAAALAGLLAPARSRATDTEAALTAGLRLPGFASKAKRVIYLVMCGGPSQLDTFDFKPGLEFNADLPRSLLGGEKMLAGMSTGQARFPVAPSIFGFKRHGKSGAWVSELLPWTAKIVDDIAIVRSMRTDSINHAPGLSYLLTSSEIPGRPSVGAWVSYGLGRINENLPTFVVLNSRIPEKTNTQTVFARLWGSGFLPSSYSGVVFRSEGDAVLYLRDPKGLDRATRRAMLDGVQELNRATYEEVGDPEIHARIEQYEMAFRMQASVPELTDLAGESAETFELYGPDSRVPGTFAYNCIMARRLAERGVRFTQVFQRGWDSHAELPDGHGRMCAAVDRGCYGLITDLKRRGLLEDTVVVWGGEFGRTVFSQGPLTATDYGRDHHGRCFTMWAAGGGIKSGLIYGETDEFSYHVVRNPVDVQDLNATVFHQLGLDHNRLTFRFQGLDQKPTGIVPAKVITDLLV